MTILHGLAALAKMRTKASESDDWLNLVQHIPF
jgi:hypothetical protein